EGIGYLTMVGVGEGDGKQARCLSLSFSAATGVGERVGGLSSVVVVDAGVRVASSLARSMVRRGGWCRGDGVMGGLWWFVVLLVMMKQAAAGGSPSPRLVVDAGVWRLVRWFDGWQRLSMVVGE
ncbi:hypothetical protein Dimus_032142, partial [Dionaea muscipula]